MNKFISLASLLVLNISCIGSEPFFSVHPHDSFGKKIPFVTYLKSINAIPTPRHERGNSDYPDFYYLGSQSVTKKQYLAAKKVLKVRETYNTWMHEMHNDLNNLNNSSAEARINSEAAKARYEAAAMELNKFETTSCCTIS